MNPVKPAPPGEMPKYSCQQNLRLSARVAALAIMIVLISEHVGNAATPNIAVQPIEMAIAAKLNDSLVLRLEVTTTDPEAVLDLRSIDLRVQREAKKIDPTHYLFLIAPDTTKPGRVDGRLDVVDKAGIVLCSVPVTGEVRPFIRVSPTRIFLGSLDYGVPSTRILEKRVRLSADVPWKIIGIDASELGDAQWEVRNEAGADKELGLRFREDAFKAKTPFGAFIKRSIRIATDSVVQPEIIIAVEGMLTHNATKRDFKTYVFRGNERWQGMWSTPNLAAAAVSPVVLLLLGYGLVLLSHRAESKRLVRVVAVTMCLGAVVGMVLLAQTYSRGGWVSFGAGWGVMLLLMKQQRFALAAVGVIFAGIIIFLPAGMQRATSAGAVSEDLSINHRLFVWRGALEMIADHPLRGVGSGQFGQVFQTYYQKPWHKDQYTTAINDYLTLAAEHGVLPVLMIVCFGVCLTVAAVKYSRRHGDIWLLPLVGALLTLGTSSVFSSVGFVLEVRLMNWLGMGALAIYCGVRFIMERENRRWEREISGGKIWPSAASAGLSAGCLLGTLVICTAWTRSASCPVPSDAIEKASPMTRIEYLPGRMVLPKGTLLFLPDSPEKLTTLGRQVLRPLAEAGWRAVTLDLRMYDQEATGQVVKALRSMDGPTLILAEGTRARVAVMAERLVEAKRRPKLIFIDPVFFSALGECDQSNASSVLLGAATIPAKQWQEFKRDGRSGLEAILTACDVSIATASPTIGTAGWLAPLRSPYLRWYR